MSLSTLIEAMAAEGASVTAILIAVRAIEAAEAKIEARRAQNRERKQRERAKSRDSHATVAPHVTPKVLETKVSPTPLSKTQSPKAPSPPSGAHGSKSERRSRRCPANWSFSASVLEAALANGLTTEERDDELSTLRDYEFATAHVDWDAVGRNWMRRAGKDKRRRSPTGGPAPPKIDLPDSLDVKRQAQERWARTQERQRLASISTDGPEDHLRVGG